MCAGGTARRLTTTWCKATARPEHHDGGHHGHLHLGYHLTTFHHFSSAWAMAQATTVALIVVIPVLVLLSLRTLPPEDTER